MNWVMYAQKIKAASNSSVRTSSGDDGYEYLVMMSTVTVMMSTVHVNKAS